MSLKNSTLDNFLHIDGSQLIFSCITRSWSWLHMAMKWETILHISDAYSRTDRIHVVHSRTRIFSCDDTTEVQNALHIFFYYIFKQIKFIFFRKLLSKFKMIVQKVSTLIGVALLTMLQPLLHPWTYFNEMCSCMSTWNIGALLRYKYLQLTWQTAKSHHFTVKVPRCWKVSTLIVFPLNC